MQFLSPAEPRSNKKLGILLASFLVFICIMLMPTPVGLSTAGQAALGVLAMVVIIWISECVSPAASAIILVGVAALGLIGTMMPDGKAPLTSAQSLNLMLGGFSSSAAILVAMALFLAVALKHTGLDKRIALIIMNAVGVSPPRLLFGAMLVGFVLALFVPSATARVGAVIPIMVGIVAALEMPINSRLGAALMIVTAEVCSVFNMGIKTAAAQNLISLDFMQKTFGHTYTWGEWFIYALPFTILMCVALFFVTLFVLRPEAPEPEAAKVRIRQQLAELGPLSPAELRLILVAVALLFLWSTEGWLHPLDTTTTTQVGIALLLMPRIGVMNWSQAEKLVPWGTVILFGAGISLGLLLSKTGAAAWLANISLGQLGLADKPIWIVIALLSVFSVVLHLGFASATGLASTLIPIVIAFTQSLPVDKSTMFGIVFVQSMVVSFGFILPPNAPQNMLCNATGAFNTTQFVKVGLTVTIIGLLLVALLSVTYWPLLGVL
ncbi:SLC13 family permease [Oleisolibacter albus]|uniref:SLC13 family permease n=1 Tax=Oleisolibacter albus TaxID=2171757 RepID=UPI000DF35D18|nr:DASS family sodium-coupled anion symporter [Oleisolibacter albus]